MGFLPALSIFSRFLCISYIARLKHGRKTFDIVESKKFVSEDISDGSTTAAVALSQYILRRWYRSKLRRQFFVLTL